MGVSTSFTGRKLPLFTGRFPTRPLKQFIGTIHTSTFSSGCSNVIVTVGPPNTFTDDHIDRFKSLVLAGGEVAEHGLRDLILAANWLAFGWEDDQLLGIAGLKNPKLSYRDRISKSSGVALKVDELPLEFGWVFIEHIGRGRGLSLPLGQSLIEATNRQGVFATSRSDNLRMHKTLNKLGFTRMGTEWPSKQNDGMVCLFVRTT